MRAVLIYAKFGPYHTARLEATGAAGAWAGHQLTGIEVAGRQRDYGWLTAGRPGRHFLRLTLFPAGEYRELSYRAIRSRLNAALDACRPDVVAIPGWAFKEALAALGWCLRRGVARVLVADSQPIDRAQNPAKAWAKAVLVRRFQAAFVGGAPHARYLAGLGLDGDRCVLGCDVVDNEYFARETRLRRVYRRPREGRGHLVSAIRLLPRKNILQVLDALAADHSRWVWTIAGEGPQRSALERRIERLGLRGLVRLAGHVGHESIPALLASADVYLQPSLSEPWGLAINEAMAARLPVIVSNRCGAAEDLVREGLNGFTFDPAVPGSLQSALAAIWQARDRWTAMGEASGRIVGAWGLGRFASGFWRACQAARAQGAGSRPSPVARVLEAIL